MDPKFLIDENLSPAVASALREQGFDACHVRDRGLLGETDAAVMNAAFDEDRVVVTSNIADFEKLARAREVHAGIVLVEPTGLRREEQCALVLAAAAAVKTHGAMINEVLRVAEDRSMVFETLPR